MSGILLVTGAGRGFAVAVNYAHSAGGANKAVADIKQAGGNAVAIKADMTVEAEIVALFEAVDRTLGKVTHLVNNAGIIGAPTATAEITAAAITLVLQTNVTGPFLCAREAVRRMATQFCGKGGAIVNIGSIVSRLGGFTGLAAYAASKAAVDGMTIALAKELGAQNVRVNTVRPGLTDTEMLDTASNRDAARELAKSTVPYGGRIARPEEIAALVLWLLSDEASYVSGAIYDVSGGR